MALVSNIKAFIKYHILLTYMSVRKVKELYNLRSIRFYSFSKPASVFIGFQDNKNSGGGLKLRDLKEFNSADNNYNALYLLSSSLPNSFGEMIHKAKKADAKVIWNQNGIGFPAWAGPQFSELNKSFKYGLERCDIALFQSKFALRSVDELVMDTSSINKVVLYNSIDTSVFKPDFKECGNSPHILVAGSHNDINRVVLSIEILAILRKSGIDGRLNIAGRIKESSLPEVRNLINQHKLADNVTFLGSYGRSDAPRIFSSSDILLHLQPFDSCPTVVVEAMASGLVVVGPGNGAIPELLGEELSVQLVDNATNYEKYDWGAPEQYAAKIISLLPMLNIFKQQARVRAVEQFDLTRWMKFHRELFASTE